MAMRPSLSLSAAMVLASASVPVPSSAAPPVAPAWEELGSAAGLPAASLQGSSPSWLDVTGDGQPEPVWLALDSVRRITEPTEGPAGLVDLEAPILTIDGLGPGGRFGAVFDMDRGPGDPGDGVDEILLIAPRLLLLRVAGPDLLVAEPVALPVLPTGTPHDVAAGDLNSDGLVDFVVALGVDAMERYRRAGTADLVLMNRGHGRLERTLLAPARDGYTHGLTLADMDGDGRLDVVESMNHSQLSGPSRVLINTTEPGATWPTFEADPAPWDPGTNGMGAAVGDLDGDGLLDIFNSSSGQDLLVLRQEDGSWSDQTLARGLTHEATMEGMRNQWGPTFSDMNADGTLDLIVRHGSTGLLGGLGALLALAAPDLLYLTDEEGLMHRAPVPYHAETSGAGRQLALGDLDRDGLPDVALGGGQATEALWRNALELEPGQRALTVRLEPTVSARPPTGAVVEGRCGGAGPTVTRHLTAGGHFGGTPTPELWLGWSSCGEPLEVEVRWPSGARSTHPVESTSEGGAHLVVEEPRWWQAEGASVALDPTGTGASEACVERLGAAPVCCAEACTLEAPELLQPSPSGSKASKEAVRVRLDDRPPQALPFQGARWQLLAYPTVAQPGQPLTVHAQRIGAQIPPDGEEPTLEVNGQTVPWISADAVAGLFVAETMTPPVGLSLELSLRDATEDEVATEALPIAHLFHPDWASPFVYGVASPPGVQTLPFWEVRLQPARGVDPTAWVELTLLADGLTPIEPKLVADAGSAARLRFQVPWAELEGVESIELMDGSLELSLAVDQPSSVEEVLERVVDVEGGILRSRLVHKGDLSAFVFSFRDAAGQPLPAPIGAFFLSIDKASWLLPAAPLTTPFDLVAVLGTDGEPGEEGKVRLITDDGRLFGPWTFQLSAPVPREADLEQSSASVSEEEVEVEGEVEVSVLAFDSWGEALGAHATIEVLVEGGKITSGPAL